LKEHLVDAFIEEAMINSSLDTEKSTFREYILLSQNTGYGDDEATHLVKELLLQAEASARDIMDTEKKGDKTRKPKPILILDLLMIFVG
jgi:hypothetical protein